MISQSLWFAPGLFQQAVWSNQQVTNVVIYQHVLDEKGYVNKTVDNHLATMTRKAFLKFGFEVGSWID